MTDSHKLSIPLRGKGHSLGSLWTPGTQVQAIIESASNAASVSIDTVWPRAAKSVDAEEVSPDEDETFDVTSDSVGIPASGQASPFFIASSYPFFASLSPLSALCFNAAI